MARFDHLIRISLPLVISAPSRTSAYLSDSSVHSFGSDTGIGMLAYQNPYRSRAIVILLQHSGPITIETDLVRSRGHRAEILLLHHRVKRHAAHLLLTAGTSMQEKLVEEHV